MKVQQMNEVHTLVKTNVQGIINNPESFVPYGTEGLTEEQEIMFNRLLDMEVSRLSTKH